MNKTKIEWTDYTLNPIKGLCKHDCFYCYMKSFYRRFKWDTNCTLKPHEMEALLKLKHPSKIFMCSTHDLFGNWIPDEWIEFIISKIKIYPQHTFQILTKNPKRPYLSNFQFPDNCWFGISVDFRNEPNWSRIFHLIHEDKNEGIKARIKFVSFEPLCDDFYDMHDFHYWGDVDWFIIGAMTGKESHIWYPKEQHIRRILNEADRFNIPVFMKDNLRPHWEGEFRQEFPK